MERAVQEGALRQPRGLRAGAGARGRRARTRAHHSGERRSHGLLRPRQQRGAAHRVGPGRARLHGADRRRQGGRHRRRVRGRRASDAAPARPGDGRQRQHVRPQAAPVRQGWGARAAGQRPRRVERRLAHRRRAGADVPADRRRDRGPLQRRCPGHDDEQGVHPASRAGRAPSDRRAGTEVRAAGALRRVRRRHPGELRRRPFSHHRGRIHLRAP